MNFRNSYISFSCSVTIQPFARSIEKNRLGQMWQFYSRDDVTPKSIHVAKDHKDYFLQKPNSFEVQLVNPVQY